MNQQSYFRTITDSPQWGKWEQEVRRRFDEHIKKKSKTFTGCWDIDESLELGEISPEHFQDFLKFVITQERESILKDIEEKYGKYGSMNGSFGYQGIVMGIQAFQSSEDSLRDSIISIITSRP